MGVRKGCYHCTKRRIRCDMAEPQCLKCIAKGLECSGNGLRYRFNDGIASRGKFRGASNPAVPNAQPPYLGKRKASPVLTSAGGREALTRRQCSGSTQQQHHLSGSEMMPWDCKARMAPVLEPINRRVEFLLNHCKSKSDILTVPFKAHDATQFPPTWPLAWWCSTVTATDTAA